MYCILVTGIPAAGKSTMAAQLSERLKLPLMSKDIIKERLFDTVGFRSRAEKVNLGIGAMRILYYFAEQMMRTDKPFILENNFENISGDELNQLLERYGYTAITVIMTGDYPVIYQRFLERNKSPERHRGHVVNTQYPENPNMRQAESTLSFEDFVSGIQSRGMDRFMANGPQIRIDTTEFSKVNTDEIVKRVCALRDELSASAHSAEQENKNG